ncbi:HNH endonuclease [Luteibacter sp.]|uniref:HNH endonuclease n=1 Tax=Luteibacter sp. TaxID=1886636 RepID=UPI003F7D6BB7
MDYHRFNIGRPLSGEMNAWWAENVERGVITTGFQGEPGDDGERHLKAPAKWDWVLAYVSGRGFVGAGRIRGVNTYHRHPAPPAGTLSDHQHERAVVWKYIIRDVNDAIRYDDADLPFPVGTRQRTTDRDAAKELVRRLRQKGESLRAGGPQYWWVPDAVRALGEPSTLKQIEAWLEDKYPKDDHSDLINQACILSVNDANRLHNDKARKDFLTNQGNPKDALFRDGRKTGVKYALYDREKHGIWNVVLNANGKPEAVQIEEGDAHKALHDARRQIASETPPPIESEHDARVWEMRAVAMREGQGPFRQGLLEAYDFKCAVTGCAVVEILEAAHIMPYRGGYTHRTDNGLLLRADIHTLFDKGMLWIDDGGFVQIDDRLSFSEDYMHLRGKKLSYPAEPTCHPKKEHLAHHRKSAAGQSS